MSGDSDRGKTSEVWQPDVTKMDADEVRLYKELTEEQKQDYKEIFDIFDTDGGGKITNDEIANVMRSLGQNPTDQEVEDMIMEIDQDGDGEVDFGEFLILMVKQLKTAEQQEEELVEVFRMFDVGQDGEISSEDLMLRFEQLGDPITKEVAEEIIKINDKDGDGTFNFTEFVQLMLFDTQDKSLFGER